MRKLIFIAGFIVTFSFVNAQNKQVLYDFADLPQTLMLNPGAEVPYKFHVGFPMLSQLSFNAGFTGFSTYDIFADDGVDINTKIKSVIDKYGKSEFFAINQQIEILNGGFRLPNNDYVSVGFYEEFDLLGKVPKDMVDLFYEGNTIIDKRYSIKKLAARAELLGVLHVGISKKINDDLQAGARVKIYSSMFHAKTSQNTGTLFTALGTDNYYVQRLQNVNALLQTSGIKLPSNTTIDQSYVQKNLLLGGNLGLGFDIGFTYHLNKQTTITGSLLDIGFIYNTKNTESFKIKGDYDIEGIQLLFNENNPQDYWNDLKDDFNNRMVLDTIYSKYISLRPVKLNGSVAYEFGRESLDDCHFINNTNQYMNKIGFQLFSNLSAVHTYLAATIFYERRINKNFQTKITYTADPFSFTNLGAGLSTHLGWFNFYVTADNLLNLANVYNSKSVNFLMGVNFIIDNN